jgi:uncharacterized protein YjbJ (UPF0337 family)
MSIGDKISNKGEELQGKAKGGVGEATDDKDLKAEGKGDQAKGNLKQARREDQGRLQFLTGTAADQRHAPAGAALARSLGSTQNQ